MCVKICIETISKGDCLLYFFHLPPRDGLRIIVEHVLKLFRTYLLNYTEYLVCP
jgi:hypothetical protein